VPKQLSQLHEALDAFEKRFEDELIIRWPGLEDKAGEADWGPSEKRSALDRFFKDAEKVIGTVVHERFPKLLQVATAQRKHLGNQSPIAWTKAQVLRQVCNFLGVDEKFDHTSAPRDDSRLVAAAAQIALGVGWPDEIPADFVLPGWLGLRWAWRQAVGDPRLTAEDDAESLTPLSRAETLEWIKHKEFSIYRKLERQIEKDSQDGIIAAAAQTSGHLSADQGTLARRPQHRPFNERKELIARLKARNQGAPARRICELIDQTIDKTIPILRDNFAPLESWQKQAPGERSWVGFYDHRKTHNQVRRYVNGVPPLKTSK
jgi:hypothetical protein